ncbi:MAG: hypothetical protein WBD44_06300 [Phycisphaerae bacterium]
MCCGKAKCEKPQSLKGKPEACPPEQVRECHGTARKHSCTTGGARRDLSGCDKRQRRDMNRQASQ